MYIIGLPPSPFGDLAGVDYSDSATPDVTYVYTRDGRRQQVTDGSGVRTISYDALGQVTTESYTSGPLAGLSLNRGTDTLLRRTSLTLTQGTSTLWSQGFGYGDASRLASVTMGDDAVQYGYVTNSPLVGSMAFGHSGSTVMTTTKQYDAVNRLTQTSSVVGGTVVSSHQNSEINTLNQRKRTNLADGTYWKYDYNGRGELLRGVLYGTNNVVVTGMDFQYTYDNSGNRLTRSQGSSILSRYTSNLVNQYTTIAETVATATPSYDADGNMTSSGSAYDEHILEYDGENRLTTVRRSGDQAVVATYTYDDQGRRVRVQTTSAAPQGAGDGVNVWDGWNLVGELDYTSATGAHQPRRTYAWGLDLSGSEQGAGGIGGLVIQRDATSGDGYFPAYDPNGNLTTLVKSSDGTVGARYSYDPYGNLLSISSDPYSGINRFRFSTKYYCPETELYYYGYRFYNPVTGRWVNRDPIEEQGGLNLYGFIKNSPIDDVDYLGLWNWGSPGPYMSRKGVDPISGNPSVFYYMPQGKSDWSMHPPDEGKPCSEAEAFIWIDRVDDVGAYSGITMRVNMYRAGGKEKSLFLLWNTCFRKDGTEGIMPASTNSLRARIPWGFSQMYIGNYQTWVKLTYLSCVNCKWKVKSQKIWRVYNRDFADRWRWTE